MAIDLQKLEQKFDALLDDPNFVTDFEQWLEARRSRQHDANTILNEVPLFVVEDRHEAYCPKCEVYLVWQQVTNDEKHCLCDTEVEWHPVGQ